MENQIQKTQPLQEKALVKNLAIAITKDTKGNDVIDVNAIDKVGVNIELKKFKHDNGAINFAEVFNIPKSERIPAMAEQDLRGTISVITVALTLAMETMNLSRKMTNVQIVDLAETIVDTASDGDVISLEDLMLFLQKLTRGEYPELFEGIDQIKFMSRFNKYRDERWEAAIELKNKKNEEFKKLGDDNFHERNNLKDASPFGQYMEHFRQKIQSQKDEIKEQKRYE